MNRCRLVLGRFPQPAFSTRGRRLAEDKGWIGCTPRLARRDPGFHLTAHRCPAHGAGAGGRTHRAAICRVRTPRIGAPRWNFDYRRTVRQQRFSVLWPVAPTDVDQNFLVKGTHSAPVVCARVTASRALGCRWTRCWADMMRAANVPGHPLHPMRWSSFLRNHRVPQCRRRWPTHRTARSTPCGYGGTPDLVIESGADDLRSPEADFVLLPDVDAGVGAHTAARVAATGGRERRRRSVAG